MQNILITGSSGFIGSNILNSLHRNYNIYITSRKNVSKKRKKVHVIYFKNHSELNKKLKKIKIDTVIHCGTHYVKNHSFSDIKKLITANIEFGVILLENLKSMKVKKFINFSTVWQNYNGKPDMAYNLYAASKISFTKILNYYAHNFVKIKFYNLFISDTYGKNDKRNKLINTIKKKIKNKKEIKIISKKLTVNLLNAEDVTNAIKIILRRSIKPGNYNVINNKYFKIYDLLKKVSKYKNFKSRLKWGNNFFKKEKVINFNKLPGWSPKNSTFVNLEKFIVGQT